MTKSKKENLVDESPTTVNQVVVEEVPLLKQLQVCYIGDSLPKHGLISGTTFKGEIPAHITQLIAQYPFIKHLLIDVEHMQIAKSKLKIAGSPENQSNARLREIQ